LIDRDVDLLQRLGWCQFVKLRRSRGDFASLDNIDHPAHRILRQLKEKGAPVQFSTPPWPRQRILHALKRGPHKSCNNHVSFLEEEFVDMIHKGQWVILPASVAEEHLPALRHIPTRGCPAAGLPATMDRRLQFLGRQH
jgi:hypothetical protein